MPDPLIAYLDNCATTMVCSEAAQKVMEAMTVTYGNPSSLHSMGVGAETMLRRAREQIAENLSCDSSEVYFTSGGTESNNTALFGAANALKRRGKRIVSTALEHSSVDGPLSMLEKEGFEVIRLKPGKNGSISDDDLFQAVNGDTILVSVMLVNNETGAVNPVETAKKAVLRSGAPALIHCDAVQAYGKLPVRPSRLGADLLSISSHKIHGPKGAGALYIRKGVRILPLLSGGGQERTIRPGTEPVPAIAGFGEASKMTFLSFQENVKKLTALKQEALRRLRDLPEVVVNSPENGAPHIINISVEGVRSETMLHYLSSKGVIVSSGSACSRGTKSRVLEAMDLSESRIDSALRISFSRYNTQDDVTRLIEAITGGAATLARAR